MEFLDRLDVDRIGICQLCLWFVSDPLADDDLRAAKREARKMTPVLWEEGLAEPALAALREAVREGVDGAVPALVDLERNGGRSKTARAIVLYLADQQHRRSLHRVQLLRKARARMPSTPEWN